MDTSNPPAHLLTTWKVVLPFPPSINRYYVNRRAKTDRGKSYNAKMVGPEGVRFRELVVVAVRRGHRAPPRFTGRLKVTVFALPPDLKADGGKNRNRRDTDNLWKALLDALTRAQVVADDCQFDDSRIIRGNPRGPGYVIVGIEDFDPDAALAHTGDLFAEELKSLQFAGTSDLPF